MSAVLLAALALHALAQEPDPPAFDSFSYLRDPLFRVAPGVQIATPAAPVECTVPEAEPEPQTTSQTVENECSKSYIEPALSQSERFELQLALDKALSQILKLTVDYEALRIRVQRLNPTSNKQGYNQQEQGRLQELLDLHAKQLAERDRQLFLLQRRLESAKSRYDSENALRLLAEKQVNAAREKNKATQETDAVSNRQFDFLTEKLKKNKLIINQLETELKVEKSARLKQNIEKSERSDGNGQGVLYEQKQSSFKVSNEWVINGLRFKQGSADIEPDSTSNLNALVEHLIQNPALSVQINGYTDSVGSVESNLRLSQARAESVAGYLIRRGVVFYRIKALGYGERRSVGDNDTKQGRLQNRRVAVLFLN